MNGKYALITGASSGIGKELAKVHASKGGNLVLVARRKEKLEELKTQLEKEFAVTVHLIVKDLSIPTAADEVFDEVKKMGIEIEYLINNAGFGAQGFFHEIPLEKQIDMINLNITALVKLTYLFLPEMLERNSGRILNVSSSASLPPGGPMQSVYFATKAFVTSFTYGLIGELMGTNVTATMLLPGATKTEFSDVANLNNTDLFKNVKFTGETVAKDGYDAMLKGKYAQLTAIKAVDRIMLKFVPFTPKKIALKMIRKMQEIK